MGIEWISFSLFAVLIGFRHGMDSDHIAAIVDMVGTDDKNKKTWKAGIMYGIGHGAIVFLMGLLAISLGKHLPASIAATMETLVGLSLLVLGAVMLASMLRRPKEYVYESRWALVFRLISRWYNRVVHKKTEEMRITGIGIAGAFIIGIVHGIGAETPTQVMMLSHSSGSGNVALAVIQLLLFVSGLLCATFLVTLCANWGFMRARMSRSFYIVLGSITALYSILLGFSILTGF
ncbi:hypothetical protein [Aneurinibacillus tyrosinisolvens]|uniref:HoxN/HupN/NixA family nickel/cobalt transporter n=1 Tax=Aneurinibacillus tyrosinisolvens TaxID=1443435 RepID=UPI00063F9945|nr:hypothetical protein [Aneurinibacillus tyrosinisolvens]